MKNWWKSVKRKVRRKYYFYKFMKPFYKMLLELKFIILKLRLQLLIDKLFRWRHFSVAGGLLAGLIYCSFVGFEYLPACIMGLGFTMWYDYYKHPEISKLKAWFAFIVLVVAFITFGILNAIRKL